MINSFLKNNLASFRGAPQENDAKFRFAIHPQGIRQFHDNCKIAKCQTVATLAPVYYFVMQLRTSISVPTFSCMFRYLMLEAIILKEINGFCDIS